MKRFLSLILILVLLTSLLSGCTAEVIAEPMLAKNMPEAKRNEITIASGYDIVSLDPHEANDTYSIEINNMIYEQLLSTDADGNIKSELAENWEIADDTHYVFHIRKGVSFHNGAELTAEDVVYSLNRAIENPNSYSALEQVASVEALDKSTVKIITKLPYSGLLRNLTSSQTSILCRAEDEKGTTSTSPIGTGPMVFTEYKPNYHVVVSKNENYWGLPARTDLITRRVIPDDSARTIALENGEVDYIGTLPSVDIERVKANTDLRTKETVSSNIAYMGFNVSKEPFNDVRLRQALHHATDKQKIIDSIYEGYGTECKSIFPTVMRGYNDELDLYPFNLERAQKLMTASGFPNGFEMEVALSSDDRSRMAQILQEDYKKIGVTIRINQMEFSTFLEYLEQDKHDAYIMSWNGASNHDLAVTTNFHSEGGNRMHYKNITVDQLIEKARETIDWDMREPYYKEIQNLIMRDSVWIPIIQQTYVSGMNKNLHFDESIENPRGYIDLVITEQ